MCYSHNTLAVLATALLLQAPAFDAASIRPSARSVPGSDWDMRPGGQFIAANISLDELVGVAFGVEPFRVVGGPAWVRDRDFDIQARAGATVTAADTRLMLRALLRERFALTTRSEQRVVAIYALVVNRADRTGPRLRTSSPTSCEPPTCGRLFTNPGKMTGRRVSMDLLATRLSTIANRVVANRTGLNGLFDVDLDWTPDSGVSLASSDAPALLTALGEQLGLKLESTTGPVDVVVIERAEQPTDN